MLQAARLNSNDSDGVTPASIDIKIDVCVCCRPFETFNDFGTMRTKMYFDMHAQPGVDVNKLSTVGLNDNCPACGWVSLYTTFDQIAAVPVPPAVWLFGSGLLGLFGAARRRDRL